MGSIDREEFAGLQGTDVLDPTGERIGVVEEVYYDDATDAPEWIGVGTDLPGPGRRAVPAADAELEGGTVRVPYALEAVRTAPAVRGDRISASSERELRAHYGLPAPAGSPDDEPTDEWEASGEDPTVGARDDQGDRLTIRRRIEDDPDDGRIGGPEVH